MRCQLTLHAYLSFKPADLLYISKSVFQHYAAQLKLLVLHYQATDV